MTTTHYNKNEIIANESVRERLKNLAISKGFENVSQFELAIDLPNGYVRKAKKITKARQLQIQSAFPDLNMSWLLTGEGDMLRPAQTTINGNNNVLGNHNNVGNNISVTKTTNQRCNYKA